MGRATGGTGRRPWLPIIPSNSRRQRKYAQGHNATSSLVARSGQPDGPGVCGLHGHDAVLHFEGNRVMMRCTSCGYDTPGWEISGQGPRLRYAGDAGRHAASNAAGRLVLRTHGASSRMTQHQSATRRGERVAARDHVGDVHVFLDAVQTRAARAEQHRRRCRRAPSTAASVQKLMPVVVPAVRLPSDVDGRCSERAAAADGPARVRRAAARKPQRCTIAANSGSSLRQSRRGSPSSPAARLPRFPRRSSAAPVWSRQRSG